MTCVCGVCVDRGSVFGVCVCVDRGSVFGVCVCSPCLGVSL